MNSNARIYQMMLEDGITPVYVVSHAKAVAGLLGYIGDNFTGSGNITTLGTISQGTWQGTPIANTYIANHYVKIGKTSQSAYQINLGSTATLTNIGIPAWAQKTNLEYSDLPALYIGATRVLNDNTIRQDLIGIGSASLSKTLLVGEGSAYDSSDIPEVAATKAANRRIYFGNSSFYLELDANGYLHTNASFYSDGFVAAGGIGASGGGSGSFDLPSMWASLMKTQTDVYASSLIHLDHLPDYNESGNGNVITAIAKDTANSRINVTKGITALTEVTSAMITTALGYTPASSSSLGLYLPLAGGTMTGAINMGGSYISHLNYISTDYNGSPVPFKIKGYNGTDIVTFNSSDLSTVHAGTLQATRLIASTNSDVAHLEFTRGACNYIKAPANGYVGIVPNGKTISVVNCDLIISDNNVYPGTTADVNLGKSDKRWYTIYANGLNLSGGITMGGGLTIHSPGSLYVDDISAADASSIFINNDVAIDAGLTISDNLSVGGNASLNGSLSIVGDITIGTDLYVDSIYHKTANTPVTFGDDVRIDADLTLGGLIQVDEIQANQQSSIFVSNDVHIEADLTVDGSVEITDDIQTGGTASFGSTLTHYGDYVRIGRASDATSQTFETLRLIDSVTKGGGTDHAYINQTLIRMADVDMFYIQCDRTPTIDAKVLPKYNNYVNLGTSASRWKGVYSTLLDISSNATIGGTLGVTGNTTLGGTLSVTGNTTFGGTVNTSDLYVDNIRSYESDLTVKDPISFEDDLQIDGSAKITLGPVTIEWDSVKNALYIHGTYQGDNIGIYTDGFLIAGEAAN